MELVTKNSRIGGSIIKCEKTPELDTINMHNTSISSPTESKVYISYRGALYIRKMTGTINPRDELYPANRCDRIHK